MSSNRTKNFTQRGFTGNFLALMKQAEKNQICYLEFLTEIFTEDSTTTTIDGNGSRCSPLSVNVKVSAEAGNALVIVADGLYATGGGGGTGTTRAPLTGIAGNGGANDPHAGTNTYSNGDIIGLGASNGGRIMININGGPMLNYGTNSAFSYNPGTGTLSGLPTWFDGDSIYIDLNQ